GRLFVGDHDDGPVLGADGGSPYVDRVDLRLRRGVGEFAVQGDGDGDLPRSLGQDLELLAEGVNPRPALLDLIEGVRADDVAGAFDRGRAGAAGVDLVADPDDLPDAYQHRLFAGDHNHIPVGGPGGQAERAEQGQGRRAA